MQPGLIPRGRKVCWRWREITNPKNTEVRVVCVSSESSQDTVASAETCLPQYTLRVALLHCVVPLIWAPTMAPTTVAQQSEQVEPKPL